MTDNSHIGPKDTSPMSAVERLKKLNVATFVIGIGTAVKLDEVAKVTGKKDNVFVIKDLSTVSHSEFTRMIVNKTCRQIGESSFTIIQDIVFHAHLGELL